MLREADLFLEGQVEAEPAGGPIPFPASMDEIARTAARAMTDRCGGNKSEAARVLGIGRRHLYSLLGSPTGGEG